MQTLLIFLAIFILLVAIAAWRSTGRKLQREKTKRQFTYTPKDSLMTPSEMDFFWKLHNVVDHRYFIFPQVHLSALLDHHVVGQNWNSAFYHINQKSVDYVLCSKTTLQPIYAIELDDPSHDRPDRITRDIEVERIFAEANIPLVRFRDYKNLEQVDIAQALAGARALTNETSVSAIPN